MPSSHGKKGWTKDTRPARTRYWTKRSLRKNKVRHLMQSNGMTKEQAEKFWDTVRTQRRRA